MAYALITPRCLSLSRSSRPTDHSSDQFHIFGSIHADRAVRDGDDLDSVAMLKRAHLFEHFALFERGRREFGVCQQEIAAVGVKTSVFVESLEHFRTGAQRRPDRSMFKDRRARERNRIARKTEREALAIDHDFDHARFESVF